MSDDGNAQPYVHPDWVMLGECTRKEIRQALERGDLQAAIIPIGATEQHNEHLALGLDIFLSTFIAQQAALRVYPLATVAPGCPVGYSQFVADLVQQMVEATERGAAWPLGK